MEMLPVRDESTGKDATVLKPSHLSRHFTEGSAAEPYETALRSGRISQNSLRTTLSVLINK